MNVTLTDTQIFNQALLRLGIAETGYQVKAVDGSDTSKYGQIAYPLYYMTRDEEIRSYKWQVALKRAQLAQAQVTTTGTWTNGSANMTVTSTTGIVPGWLVTNALIQGGGSISIPAGIPAGTSVLSITNSTTLVMSAQATANGTGQVIFQVNNLTGSWFAYTAPTDILRNDSIYSVFPNFTYLWPFKVQHIIEFAFQYEAGYIYTDLDPGNGNPVIEYVSAQNANQIDTIGTTAGTIHVTSVGATVLPSMVGWSVVGSGIPLGATIAVYVSSSAFDLSVTAATSVTGGTIYLAPPTSFSMDFAEALALRLAWKMALPVTQDLQIMAAMQAAYGLVIVRAQGNNNIEKQEDEIGTAWWTERGY